MLCTTVHLLLTFTNRSGFVFYEFKTFLSYNFLLGGSGEKTEISYFPLLVEKKVQCVKFVRHWGGCSSCPFLFDCFLSLDRLFS